MFLHSVKLPLEQRASWAGAERCLQTCQNPRGGVICPPKIRPTFFNQWSRSWTAPATKAPGPQRFCRPLLPLLSLPSVCFLLSYNPRPFWHRPRRAPEVFAPAVCASSKVHVDIWGADRRVHQRLLAPAPSNSFSLVWAADCSRSFPQASAFADAQALPPIPAPSSWTVAQQGEPAYGAATSIMCSQLSLTFHICQFDFIRLMPFHFPSSGFGKIRLPFTEMHLIKPQSALNRTHFFSSWQKWSIQDVILCFDAVQREGRVITRSNGAQRFSGISCEDPEQSLPVNGPLCFLLT